MQYKYTSINGDLYCKGFYSIVKYNAKPDARKFITNKNN